MAKADVTAAIWSLNGLDSETKLYLLALARVRDAHGAAELAGMRPGQARLTIGWLKEAGVVREDDTVDTDALQHWAPHAAAA